jgi:hypothetical protein
LFSLYTPLTKLIRPPYRLLLLAIVVYLFTFQIGGQGLVLPSLQDSSHALVFGLATNLLLLAFSPAEPISNTARAKYVLAICSSAFLFGIFVELVQPFFGRNKSLLDASYDLAGCSAAGLFYWCKHAKHVHSKPTILLIAWIQVLSCLVIPASNIWVVIQRNLSAPMLVSFDASWERHIRSINDSTTFSIVNPPEGWKHPSLVGKFTFGFATYPGISFPDIYSNWSDYSTLSFSVYSKHPQAETLHLRIHDTQHNQKYSDRYNQILTILPGLNLIEVDLNKIKHSPKSRELDLSSIVTIGLFMTRLKEPVTLYIDDIQLR